MAWLRYGDGWNRRPEIQALDDASFRGLLCIIEAAENFDACGMVPDDYVLTTYPHARQKLRNKIGKPGKLAQTGLVHLLSGPDDRDHDCPTCQTRWEELRGEDAEELQKKLGTSSATSTQSGKTDPIYICVRDFFDVAMTPTQKRQTKQGNAKRQRKKRQEDKAAASRRDEQAPSHPSVPVPVPGDDHNDPIAPEERAPTSTASPSTPSSLVPELVKMLAEGRKLANCLQPKSKPADRERLEAVARKAIDAPGDTVAILTGAVDAFFADPDQLKYRYSPAGLAYGFDRYAAEALGVEAEAFKAQKRAESDAAYQRAKAAHEARADEERKQRQRQREANGTPLRGRNLEPLAGLVPTISGGKG